MMLDANDPNFAARYPYGATVRDRWGRQLFGVISCNPETGEVVMCKGTWLTKQLLRVTGRGPMFGVAWHHGFRWVSPPGDILRRHGFWPARLTIEAKRGMILAVERNP